MRRRTALATLAGVAVLGIGVGGNLLTRPPPHAMTKRIMPQRSRNDGGTLFIDFGGTWFGNVVITPDQKNRGAAIALRLGEKLDATGSIDRKPFGSVRYYETEAVLQDNGYSPPLTPADLRGVEGGQPAMPFRYVEVDGWRGDLPAGAIQLAAVTSTKFASLGHIAFIGKSDTARRLNRLMALGAHTMEATSFLGLFIDGDRERIPYEADGLINQLGWYAVTGDWTVPRRTIEALIQKPTWPSEWMVQLVFMVWADYRATGDRAFLGQVFDRLKLFSLVAFIDATGLVTTTNKAANERFVRETGADYLQDIVDWPQGERDGYDMRPYNTVVNAFVYAGLRIIAEMATELGRTADANAYSISADRLGKAIEDKLVDPKSGLFIDGVGSGHTAAHANFFPLAFGLVPANRLGAVVDLLHRRVAAFDGGFPCSVYGAQYLLEALFRSGEGKLAVELMLNTTERGWLHMLDAYDATVTHEAWDVKFKPNIDWTHAWGSAFLNITQRFILGARMLAPAWGRWTIRPDATLRELMEASIPTPHGVISVSVDPVQRLLGIRSPKAAAFVPPAGTGNAWTVTRLELY